MAAQADQSRRAVRAGALFGVLVLARLLNGLGVEWSSGGLWILPVIVSHDAAVAILFWAVDRVTGRSRWLWIAYWAVVALAAVNVPVVKVLGASLTVPMVRAARGPLFDSIRLYVTALNLLMMTCVVLAAAVLPVVLRLVSMRVRWIALASGAALVAAAYFAPAHVATGARERNAVTGLASSVWPRVTSIEAPAGIDWRASPFPADPIESVTGYRTAGAGFNLLLIVLESTAAQYLASYGAADDPMPTVTALGKRSLVVDGMYSPYPESIRALFSLGCARSPAFDVPAEQLVQSACDSLPVQLGRAGYRTALFHSGRFAYLGMTETLATLRFDAAVDAGGIGGRVESSFGVDEPSAVQKMLEWIDQSKGAQPFFLMYMPTAGHHPYASSGDGPFDRSNDFGAYKNSIHEGDSAIATLLEGLRARGLDSRTMVVVTADHGEAFGQHAGNFAHSFYVYDENIRVPLIVHVPGRPAQRLSRVSSLVDLAPTVLDIVGAPPPEGAEGKSLLDGPARMTLFFTDYAVGWLGLRDGCLKYILEVGPRRSQLYDVCRDPGETINLAAERQDRVAAYRDRVEQWAAARRAAVLATGPRMP